MKLKLLLAITAIVLTLPLSNAYSQSKDSVNISIENAAWIADRLDFADSCAMMYKALKRDADSLNRVTNFGLSVKDSQIKNLQGIIDLKNFEIESLNIQKISYERELEVIAKVNENLLKAIKASSNAWKAPVIGLVSGAAIGSIVGAFVNKDKGIGVGAISGAAIGLFGTIGIKALIR